MCLILFLNRLLRFQLTQRRGGAVIGTGTGEATMLVGATSFVLCV